MGKWIMVAGAVVFAIGAILHFAPWMLNWFGRLPGDIRIETENGKFFFPITSMLLLSLVLTILINLFRRQAAVLQPEIVHHWCIWTTA